METCAGHNGEAASECPLLLMRNGNKRFGDLEEKGQELSQFYSFPGQNRTKAASKDPTKTQQDEQVRLVAG